MIILLLWLAFAYVSGVVINSLVAKVVNKFKPETFCRYDMPFVWLSWITWFFAFIIGIGWAFEQANNKFKNWIFK